MTRTLADSFLDPFLILYYYLNKEDFKMKGFKKIAYFSINFIFLIIIIICGLIYNELVVLFCCDLQHDTHSEISNRATEEKNQELSSILKSYNSDVNDSF